MKGFLTVAAVAAVLSLAAVAAYADLARPKDGGADRRTRHENTLKLVIESGDNPEPQLWLPPEVRVENAGVVDSAMPPARTVAAGVALSLSLAFGGLWLVRSSRTLGVRATAGAATVLCVLAGTAVFALANAAPPRNYRTVDAGTLGLASPDGTPLTGEIRYYYGSDSGVVRLVLPKRRG
jgi:hypothetical protein